LDFQNGQVVTVATEYIVITDDTTPNEAPETQDHKEEENVIVVFTSDCIKFDDDEEVVINYMTGGIPYIDKRATLFVKGNQKGYDYTEQDLQDIVDAFVPPTTDDPLDWTIPIQTDHSDSAWATVGHHRKLWHDGEKLHGILRFVGAEAVGRVMSGLWKKLSVGLFLKPKVQLRETTVTPFPYVTEAMVYKQIVKKGDESMANAKEVVKETAEFTETPADPVVDKVEQPVVEEPKTEEHSEPIEEAKETEPEQEKVPEVVEAAPEVKTEEAHSDTQEVVKHADEIERIKAEFAEKTRALEDQIQKQQEVIHFKEVAEFVNKFSEKGKIIPAMREEELDFVNDLNPSQLAKYGKIKDNQPSFVDFSRKASAELVEPGEVKKDAKATARELLANIGFKEENGKMTRV